MRCPRLPRAAFLSTAIVLTAWRLATADEGLWLFNDLPKEYLKKQYGFEPTAQWADHLMKASVRFNVGGSASFVSSTGLVLTNHHVGSDTLQKLSTSEHNYYEDGFLARSQGDEIKAPDLELNQLVSIEDVTARVNAAVKPDPPHAHPPARPAWILRPPASYRRWSVLRPAATSTTQRAKCID